MFAVASYTAVAGATLYPWVATERFMSRVLIVDDNRDAGDALREVIELSGHESHVACDPASALEWARESRTDADEIRDALGAGPPRPSASSTGRAT